MMMRPILQITIASFLVLFYLLTSLGQAEPATPKQATEQQRLQSVLEKLDQATQQRQQKKTQVDKLSHQLECNWTLIRAYEVCAKLHKNDPAGHLQCSAKAKQNAARCQESDKK